jgi:four helix bundle protein
VSGWCRVPRAWRPFKSSKAAFKSDFVAFNIMEKVRRFEDLEAFQKARELCKNVYSITNQEPFKSDYRFVQQIRAAAGSVMDNIAEGYERNGNKELVNFLYIAKGSCGEVRSQIVRASDVGFLDSDVAKQLYGDCLSISKLLNSLIISINKSGYTGKKYHAT